MIFMNLRLIVTILVIAAVPVCAQAQKQSAAKVTKRDAQKVVRIISGDKAKTQTYCDMAKLGEQIEQANEKKDNKMVDELSQKLLALGEKLDPEYAALMDGLQDIDPVSQDVEEIESVLVGLDRLCTR
jgi:ABC-type transporter MlaC component